MSHTAAPARRSANSLHINLSDGPCAELWVRAITKAVQPATESLDVYFLGGRQLIEPAALLSLRNALMLIPESVTLRTIATTSLKSTGSIPKPKWVWL